jgi:hypothetical protein
LLCNHDNDEKDHPPHFHGDRIENQRSIPFRLSADHSSLTINCEEIQEEFKGHAQFHGIRATQKQKKTPPTTTRSHQPATHALREPKEAVEIPGNAPTTVRPHNNSTKETQSSTISKVVKKNFQ